MWTDEQMPDQHGRFAVVTGANTGIGFEAAKLLAGHGAAVVLACRDLVKANDAVGRIRASIPGANLRLLRLDLASLASIREAADELRASYASLDLLINNAGLMMPPYTRTEDGFELQFGTNHLGHFALTGLLLDLLLAAPGSRVVTVTSDAHRHGEIDFDDLQFERRKYRPLLGYTQSKLANLLFTYELQRRLASSRTTTLALAAHPGGIPTTHLTRHLSGLTRDVTTLVLNVRGQRNIGLGALPLLRAAVDPAVRGGEYYAPGGRGRFRGYPKRSESSAASHDIYAQRRLWEESERLTGVIYRIEDAVRQTAGFERRNELIMESISAPLSLRRSARRAYRRSPTCTPARPRT